MSKAGEISVSGYEDEGLPFEEVVGEYKCLARSVLGNHSTTFRLLKEKNTQPTYKNQDNPPVHDNPGDEAGVNSHFMEHPIQIAVQFDLLSSWRWK